ncbi:S1 family peptidase [Spirillospora sp. CA-294931]|uniref:S1 family peptidase n=1 Tax=Spirillospora sp. CA-294931 TaxID=3240042 RepID=UPI003D8F5817
MQVNHVRITAAALGAGIAASALVAAAAPASADAEAARAAAVQARADLGRHLTERLGAERTAGAFIDGTGRLVVNVTDAGAARAVRSAGAQARQVARSGERLAGIHRALQKSVTTAGTAYSVDPRTNTVTVSIDGTVNGARLRAVTAKLRAYGAAVRTERIPGTLKPLTRGGERIWMSGNNWCSLGFNAKKGGEYYFVTAGHCNRVGGGFWTDQGLTDKLGSATISRFPGDDYAVVKYGATPTDTQGGVKGKTGTVDITGAAAATVGQRVTRSGSTTGVHEGQVTALDQTVNYAEGQVRGLIKTTVCAEGGDSGGALFAGNKALGLTSGGNGDCRSGGTTYFNPVGEALSAGGLTLY